jgi:tRNA A37 threonylcarbamoyladenosine synthetase subunit TsaC/SUA5/YrdC
LASNKNSIEKVNKIKSRNDKKPISICVSTLNDIKKFVYFCQLYTPVSLTENQKRFNIGILINFSSANGVLLL